MASTIVPTSLPAVIGTVARNPEHSRIDADGDRDRLPLPSPSSDRPSLADKTTSSLTNTKNGKTKATAATRLPPPTKPTANKPNTIHTPTPTHAQPSNNSVGTNTNTNPNTNTTNNTKPFHCKLNALQISSLLKPFWTDLLQNQLKPVRRILQENHLKTIDFDSTQVRYAPSADATPLHLCAQFGFLSMAKMLVNEFQLSATHRNKMGSTPLHVACKSSQCAVVSWLLDELHVPLDVPDTHHRIALDVAPYDVVDTCVLVPLRGQLAVLKEREQELLEENARAQEELASAQLQFRQHAMLLSDSESHVDELRAKILSVSRVERHWYEQLHARNQILETLDADYEVQRQLLQQEQANAQVLYDKQVRSVQEAHTIAHEELLAMQQLVETTQAELLRREQLLMDQVGVFDAALTAFPGSKEVQQWAIATLTAIAHSGDFEMEEKHDLLLRGEPVDVVRHVLSAFPSDYVLQCEALALLVALQRLHADSERTEGAKSLAFIKALVDSDLLLLLGETLARWFEATEHGGVCLRVWEALYLWLRLPSGTKNAQRVVAFCQRKHLHLLPLRTLASSCVSHETRCFVSLVLLTQAQYGVKKMLLSNGIVRVIYKWLGDITATVTNSSVDCTEQSATTIETAHNLLAMLALLTSLNKPPRSAAATATTTQAKRLEPPLLEELTTDTEAISACAVLKLLRWVMGMQKHTTHTLSVVQWAFKLLLNLVTHGGATAHRIRQELLSDQDDVTGDAVFVVMDGMHLALTIQELSAQTMQAALDLLETVWIQRFDHEGQLHATRPQILTALVDVVVLYTTQLLIRPVCDSLVDLASALQALSCAAGNAHNALCLSATTLENSVLQPILLAVITSVEDDDPQTTSYREPAVVTLLVHVLRIFLLVSRARIAPHKEIHGLTTTTTTSNLQELHKRSREIRVCAVLKVFKTEHHEQQLSECPRDWLALKALCMQIQELTHCPC